MIIPPIINLEEYFRRTGKYSHKCERCGKWYAMPKWYIDQTRMRVCATCEHEEDHGLVIGGLFEKLYKETQDEKN